MNNLLHLQQIKQSKLLLSHPVIDFIFSYSKPWFVYSLIIHYCSFFQINMTIIEWQIYLNKVESPYFPNNTAQKLIICTFVSTELLFEAEKIVLIILKWMKMGKVSKLRIVITLKNPLEIVSESNTRNRQAFWNYSI